MSVSYAFPKRQLNSRGGDGTSGGVSDDWKASFDRQLAQLHGDVRNLLLGGLAAVVLLLTAIGGLYLHTDGKFDGVEGRLRGLEIEAAKTNAKLDQLLERTGPRAPQR